MSVWDDIADSREEAETQVRAALIRTIRARSMGRVVAVHRCAEPWPDAAFVCPTSNGGKSRSSRSTLSWRSQLGIHVRVEVDADTALSG